MFKFILVLLFQFAYLNSSPIDNEPLSLYADPGTVENVAFVRIGTYSKYLVGIFTQFLSISKTYLLK